MCAACDDGGGDKTTTTTTAAAVTTSTAPSDTTTTETASTSTSTIAPVTDVHVHLFGKSPQLTDFAGAAAQAAAAMDKKNVERMLLLPSPFTPDNPAKFECDELAGALQDYPGRFNVLCGGGTLNPMIQQAVAGTVISVDGFKSEARRLAAVEGFRGFGEFAVEHFCLGPNHEYIAAPADHELFLALVDVAAEVQAPLDIHMEGIPQDMAFPDLVSEGCAQNPATLAADIPAFKVLLDHAAAKTPPVKIIWDHLGWDNTRQRTAALCDELLEKSPNLYMHIKRSPTDSFEETQILDTGGAVKPEWLALFEKYPDRFMIGSDQFFSSPMLGGKFPPHFNEAWAVAAALPAELAKKFSADNPALVYGW